ncbi:MAG: NUDIX domain-containing protein [Candidatus Pacebacteria bacterium]|nr:NUDIX domain-containing protein [Candidatus Paceibacterota bacterium]
MEKIRPKVGVGIIVKNKSKILLLKRAASHGKGTWSPPGGHLEMFEDLEFCAKREVMEEAGIKIKNLNFLGITNDKFRTEGKHYITIFMQADFGSGKIMVCEKDKSSDINWFPINKLPHPLFLPLADLINNKSYPKGIWDKIFNKK